VQTNVSPPAEPSDVITFDFAPQLLYLLQNPANMIADNIILDLQDPLKHYTRCIDINQQAQLLPERLRLRMNAFLKQTKTRLNKVYFIELCAYEAQGL
jgi:hypothetical protein